jgi:hypothetical protein
MVEVHSICWVEQVSGGTPGRNDESRTFTISRIIVKSRPEDQPMSDFAEPEPLGSVEKPAGLLGVRAVVPIFKTTARR